MKRSWNPIRRLAPILVKFPAGRCLIARWMMLIARSPAEREFHRAGLERAWRDLRAGLRRLVRLKSPPSQPRGVAG